MGLKTLWAQLSGQKVEEISLTRRFPDEQVKSSKSNIFIYERELDDLSVKPILPNSTPLQSQNSIPPQRRKSWFGSRPINNEIVPHVPSLDVSFLKPSNHQELRKPRAAVTTDSYNIRSISEDPASGERKRKSRRFSLSRKSSWYSSTRAAYEDIEALPPMPSIPFAMKQSATSSPSHPSPDHTSTTKHRSYKRRSFWESSNPDETSDDDQIPALVRDGSATPESRHSREYRRKDSKQDEHTTNKATSPSVPHHRRTYTPRNAAAGFLMSTSGAPEAARKTFRKSFRIADGEELVCLTDEQRREWEKLKSLSYSYALEEPETQDCNATEDAEVRPKYSNKQALAALEFGLR